MLKSDLDSISLVLSSVLENNDDLQKQMELSVTRQNVMLDLNNNWKFYSLEVEEDVRRVSERIPLSENFKSIAGAGYFAISSHIRQHCSSHEQTSTKVSDRTVINAYSANTGKKPLLNPFSEEIYYSKESVSLEWYAIRTLTGSCFVCERSEVSVYMGVENLWLFPAERIIARVDNGLPLDFVKEYICSFITSLCNKAAKARRYVINKSDRSIGLSDWHCPHLAHNLWNIQTGWINTFQMIETGRITHIFERPDQNYFGSAQELYDDYLSDIKVISSSDEDSLVEEIFNSNIFVLAIKDENITNELVRRIKQHAYNNISPAVMSEIKHFRERCHPIVMATIRLDNRAWVEQVDGIASCCVELKRHFPSMGVVLDGISVNSLKGWSTDWMSLESELAIADEIKSRLSNELPVLYGVGRKFLESLVVVDQIDFFLAPIGSGMTFCKWLSNKPGVGYSNTTALNEKELYRPLKVWDHFTENEYKPIYVHSSKVKDMEVARGSETRSNFSLDWREIFALALREMVELFPNYMDLRAGSEEVSSAFEDSEKGKRSVMVGSSTRILPSKMHDVVETLAKLCPRDLLHTPKKRFGRLLDGGYVVANCLTAQTILISYGVGNETSFETDVAKEIDKAYLFDHTVAHPPKVPQNVEYYKEGVSSVEVDSGDLFTIDQHLDRFSLRNASDLILKMDVEGAEIGVFRNISNSTITCFSQIILELHWLDNIKDRPFKDELDRALDNINKFFTLIHVHSNNGLPVQIIGGLPVAPVLELSYVRSDLHETVPNQSIYPTSLDFPNDNFLADNILHFFPFIPGSEEMLQSKKFHQSLQAAIRSSNWGT